MLVVRQVGAGSGEVGHPGGEPKAVGVDRTGSVAAAGVAWYFRVEGVKVGGQVRFPVVPAFACAEPGNRGIQPGDGLFVDEQVKGGLGKVGLHGVKLSLERLVLGEQLGVGVGRGRMCIVWVGLGCSLVFFSILKLSLGFPGVGVPFVGLVLDALGDLLVRKLGPAFREGL